MLNIQFSRLSGLARVSCGITYFCCATEADLAMAGADPARITGAVPSGQFIGGDLEDVVAAARHSLSRLS